MHSTVALYWVTNIAGNWTYYSNCTGGRLWIFAENCVHLQTSVDLYWHLWTVTHSMNKTLISFWRFSLQESIEFLTRYLEHRACQDSRLGRNSKNRKEKQKSKLWSQKSKKQIRRKKIRKWKYWEGKWES